MSLCIIAVLPTEMSRKHVSLWFFKGNVEIEARENAPLSQFRFTCESDLEICMERMLPKEPYPHVNSEHKGYALLLHAYIYIYIGYTCHNHLTVSINIHLGCSFCWAVDSNWKL